MFPEYAYHAVNLLIIFISMGFVAHSPPNFQAAMATYGYTAAEAAQPVLVQAIVSNPIFSQVNGVFNMVFGQFSGPEGGCPAHSCRSADSSIILSVRRSDDLPRGTFFC